MNWADTGSQKQVVNCIDFAILKGNKKGQNIKRLIRNIEQKEKIRESDDTSSYILVCIKTFY